ncbi:MAG TPA: DUF2141 domain-containing protein [Acidisarcina sp.]|nr:DUF2141 domain-containing protein [Acidisarcina sp.]
MIFDALRLPALLVLSLLFVARPGFADSSSGCQLVIHVDKIRNEKGALGATIFRSPDGWPENTDKAFRHGPYPIMGSTGTATFADMPPGDYAVAVIHDENGNRKMDRNIFGWPLEGFGFANNPKVLLKAPPFQEALVHVACPVTEITIHMTYK